MVTEPKSVARYLRALPYVTDAVTSACDWEKRFAEALRPVAIPSVPPKCGVAFDVTATIKNASAMATSFAELRFAGGSSQSLSVPLTPGASVLATVRAKPFRGRSGKHFLTLEASGPATFQPGFCVDMSMSSRSTSP